MSNLQTAPVTKRIERRSAVKFRYGSEMDKIGRAG
jgi:hypothetical protein